MANTMYDALVQQASGGRVEVMGSIQSLPVSEFSRGRFDAFIALFASLVITIPFAFVAAQYITPLVRERESGSKQMQFTSGVGALVYWLANWAWDLLLHVVITGCSLAIFKLEGREEFTGTAEAFGGTALLLLCFGLAVVPLASAASFLFETPSNGLIVMITLHFLTGFGFNVLDFILSVFYWKGDIREINRRLRGLYFLFPAYCLGQGFFRMSTRNQQTVQAAISGGEVATDLYDWKLLGAPLTYLLAEAVVFHGLTLLLQLAVSNVSLQQKFEGWRWLQLCLMRKDRGSGGRGDDRGGGVRVSSRGSRSSFAGLEDDDVLEERRLIDSRDGLSAPLVIMHLRRVFGSKVAVRDLCLSVQHGECFGFLGVNGAGKSTTFAMLTGALVPSAGDALLEGQSILHEQSAIRRLIGYCPQHDALEKLMTAREALRMYARIKGVDAHEVEAEVDGLLHDLDLIRFADKPCGTYSGGNKRKLCVGIALVGSPHLVLLDEPSSGMDAASKRFLWNVIKRRTAQCSVLLTSHSMEECEALCGRIGVMVEGTLRCIGPIQTLKSTYGQGYKLDLHLGVADADPESLLHVLQSRCDAVELLELEPPSMTLTVPHAAVQLSQLFGLLAELKASNHVADGSITQCTLEQIFIQMASKSTMRSGSGLR